MSQVSGDAGERESFPDPTTAPWIISWTKLKYASVLFQLTQILRPIWEIYLEKMNLIRLRMLEKSVIKSSF